MSNTFYCKSRRLTIPIDKCEQFRVAVDNGVFIDPCADCVKKEKWRDYQADPVVIEPAKQLEPKRGPQPKPEVIPKKSEPIVEAQKRCACGSIIGSTNKSGMCKVCRNREKNYSKGRTCKQCGVRITDYSKSGLCLNCSARTGWEQSPVGRSMAVPKTGGKTMETIKTHESECIPTEPVETVVIQPYPLMPPESLGAAKLAIERAFQEAERYREIRSLLQDLVDMEENRKATMTRIRELVA